MAERTVNEKRGDLENIAYEQIKMAIVQGVYPPGCQMVEEMIASQLNMSRSPVRIAIKQLEAEGFLEKHANKRIYVVQGNAGKTVHMLHVRKALEGMAARLAAQYREEEDIQRFYALMQEMDTCVEEKNVLLAYHVGMKLHYAVYNASQNPELARVAGSVLERESVFSYRSLQQDLQRVEASRTEHAKIVQAIIERDGEEADRLAQAHIEKLIVRAQSLVTQEQMLQGMLTGANT